MVQPLLVEAPGKLYQTFGSSILKNGVRYREVDSLRSLKADIGHGFMGMAKIIEHSATAEIT